MFERFSREARAAIVMAQEEARSLGDNEIHAGHLLLGVLAVGTSPAARALTGLGADLGRTRARITNRTDDDDGDLDADALATVGIDLAQVRQATEAAFGPGALDRGKRFGTGHIPFGRSAKKCLELTLREAISHADNQIRDGYLLLGMLRAAPNPATDALRGLGLDLDTVRDTTERALQDERAA